MKKALFYLPTILLNTLRCWILPRRSFIETYCPSGECVRQSEEQLRNATRLTNYYAKRTVTPRN